MNSSKEIPLHVLRNVGEVVKRLVVGHTEKSIFGVTPVRLDLNMATAHPGSYIQLSHSQKIVHLAKGTFQPTFAFN